MTGPRAEHLRLPDRRRRRARRAAAAGPRDRRRAGLRPIAQAAPGAQRASGCAPPCCWSSSRRWRSGFGARLRRLTPADRERALASLDARPARPAAQGDAHRSRTCHYYGDLGVMRLLGYDPEAVVARAARPLVSAALEPAPHRRRADRHRRRLRHRHRRRRRARSRRCSPRPGCSVAILEEGERHEPATLDGAPARHDGPPVPRRRARSRPSATPPIVLPLGRGVGGTTLVNSGTCFRTPAPRARPLARASSASTLRPRWTCSSCVEEAIDVARGPAGAGRAQRAARQARAPSALGWSRRLPAAATRAAASAPACARSAARPAPSSTPASGLRSRARRTAGATTFTGATRASGSWSRTAARARCWRRTAGGGRDRACARDRVDRRRGALHTPLLLRRNGLGGGSGRARPQPVDPPGQRRARALRRGRRPWAGVPQSVLRRRARRRRDHARGHRRAARLRGDGDAAHRRRAPRADARRAPHRAVRRDGLRHRARDACASALGRPVDPLRPARRRRRALPPRLRAAGAASSSPPARARSSCRSPGVPDAARRRRPPLRRARVRPRQTRAMAFHPLGTARAGADPARVRGGPASCRSTASAALYVADGSVVPSSLGVNPQITIMALAARLARSLSA